MAQWGRPFEIDRRLFIELYHTDLPFGILDRESKVIDIILLGLQDKIEPDESDNLAIERLREKCIGITAPEMQEMIDNG
jgi:hypothetical protein